MWMNDLPQQIGGERELSLGTLHNRDSDIRLKIVLEKGGEALQNSAPSLPTFEDG